MRMVRNFLLLCAVVTQRSVVEGENDFEWTLDGIRSGGLNKTEKRLFIELHNTLRGGITNAAGMPFARWSTELERVAANISNTCENYYHPDKGYGHNHFFKAIDGVQPDANPFTKQFVEAAMTDWESNKDRYDPVANTCEEGYDCSSYLQLVQSSTLYFGCAIVACGKHHNSDSGSAVETDGYLFTCVYDGVDPRSPEAATRPPYEISSTSPCSSCPTNLFSYCYNNLCRTGPSLCLGVQCPDGMHLNTDYCDCDCDLDSNKDVYCGESQGDPLACLRGVAAESAKPCRMATSILLLAVYFFL